MGSIFCGTPCTAHFVSDLVGNPKDRFSHDVAHFNIVACLSVQRYSLYKPYVIKISCATAYFILLPVFHVN